MFGFVRRKKNKSPNEDPASGATEPSAVSADSLVAGEFVFSEESIVQHEDHGSNEQVAGDTDHVASPGHEPSGSEVLLSPEEISDYSNMDRIYPRSPNEAIQPEAPPQPPANVKKRKPLTSLLNGIISAAIFFLLIGGGVFLVGFSHFVASGPLTQDKNVIIPSGDGLNNIATRLLREGVISDTYIFIFGVSAVNGADKLKAGEFLFKEGASMREVMTTIIEGKAILHSVTLPEGRTSQQIVEILRADPMLIGELTNIPGEGTLMPETYKFSRGTSRQSIVQRMSKDMQREVQRIWEQRDKSIPLSSPEELVILASIVEKETGKADERPRVAAVFINRLRQGIKLQSDPTIIYGLVGGKGSLGRGIRRSEIDLPTAYNTYQIQGLPPTPIANPGLAALEATANPSRTNDLFFVADGTGGHVFAKSLAEHNRNVANWRAVQQQAAQDQAAQDQAAQQEAQNTSAENGADNPSNPSLHGILNPPLPELMLEPPLSAPTLALTPPPQRN